MNKQQVIFEDLGQVDYQTAWDYQEKLLQANVMIKAQGTRYKAQAGTSIVIEQQGVIGTVAAIHSLESGDKPNLESKGQTTHHLLFVEHPPVYTLGKSGKMQNVLINEEQRNDRGIEFFKTNRGGDITFHGPQQIVGYPILDLEKFYTDIGRYLRSLEEVMILTLAEYGITGGRSPGETGVWIDPQVINKERKICALGVRCSRWITMHGFAFNVNTDLDYFNHIIPCGIQNKQVTSLQKELGRHVDFEEAKNKVKMNFAKVFDVDIVSPTALHGNI